MFGDETVVPTLLYFFANTTYFWTMGNFLEAMDGVEATHAKRPKLLSKETVKRVFSPPLCGFLAAIAFILADVQVPGAILSAAQYLGGITTPLALIFIGIMNYTIGIRNVRFDKDLTLVFLGRFVIYPLVCLGLTQAFSGTRSGRRRPSSAVRFWLFSPLPGCGFSADCDAFVSRPVLALFQLPTDSFNFRFRF